MGKSNFFNLGIYISKNINEALSIGNRIIKCKSFYILHVFSHCLIKYRKSKCFDIYISDDYQDCLNYIKKCLNKK